MLGNYKSLNFFILSFFFTFISFFLSKHQQKHQTSHFSVFLLSFLLSFLPFSFFLSFFLSSFLSFFFFSSQVSLLLQLLTYLLSFLFFFNVASYKLHESFVCSFIFPFSSQPVVRTAELTPSLLFFLSLKITTKNDRDLSPPFFLSFISFFFKYHVYRHTGVHTEHLCFILLEVYHQEF